MGIFRKRWLLPDADGANRAAVNNRVPVLEWLASKKVHPDRRGLEFCVKFGKVQALRWMMRELPDMVPSSQDTLYAAETGRLGVIKHIHKTRPGLLDYPVLLAVAKAEGWDRTVNFLETHAPNPKSVVVWSEDR